MDYAQKQEVMIRTDNDFQLILKITVHCKQSFVTYTVTFSKITEQYTCYQPVSVNIIK